MDYRNHPKFGFIGNRRSGKTTRIFNAVLLSARFGYKDIEVHCMNATIAKQHIAYFDNYLTNLKIPHTRSISYGLIKIESLGAEIRFRPINELNPSAYKGRSPIIYIDEVGSLLDRYYSEIGKVVGISFDGNIMPD